MVSFEEAAFHLDDYVGSTSRSFIRHIGRDDLHVISGVSATVPGAPPRISRWRRAAGKLRAHDDDDGGPIRPRAAGPTSSIRSPTNEHCTSGSGNHVILHGTGKLSGVGP